MVIREEPQKLNKAFPFSVNKICISKDSNHPEVFHWHDCLEITCIKEGSGSYYVNGKVYEMHAGDIIIFNNIEPHAWEVTGNGDMLALVAVFSTTLVSEKASLFDYEYLRPFIERGANFKNRLLYSEKTTQRIFSLIEDTYEEYLSKNDGYNLMIKAIILQVLTLLIRYYQDDAKPKSQLDKRKTDMERIGLTLEYIRKNYDGDITLESAAKTACMSPNYFSAFFKKATGETFIDYLCQQRIFKACELIKNTKKSITQIASECGFNNMSNFYRSYKRILGEHPLQSRKSR
jgi:AraC-like DNA-binding protein/quercetin dioxygenase-like cupin family protein